MKKCPYCAEEIQEEAVKCRYCGEWLGITETDNSRPTRLFKAVAQEQVIHHIKNNSTRNKSE